MIKRRGAIHQAENSRLGVGNYSKSEQSQETRQMGDFDISETGETGGAVRSD